MNEIKSILLDTSFCIRFLKEDDEFHQNCVDYYEYFIANEIKMYLSAIVVSEYSVKDNPENLISLNSFRLLEFDYLDAKCSGEFLASLIKEDKKLSEFGNQRVIVMNDIKLFAQIYNRKIEGYITKDQKSISKLIDPLKKHFHLSFEPIDLADPLNKRLGTLF